MSSIRVTMQRTMGLTRNLYATAFAVSGFMALSAVVLVFRLDQTDDVCLPFVAVWTVSVAAILPVLAAILSMDSWSEERQSGRLELLLSVAVRERDLVLGKFLGVWLTLMLAVLSFWGVSVFSVWLYASHVLSGVSLLGFLPGLVALGLLGGLCVALTMAASALVMRGAAALCASLALTVVLPRISWWTFLTWSERTSVGEMPVDAYVIDFASGIVSVNIVLGCVVAIILLLFITSKFVLLTRCVGRGAKSLRVSTAFAVLLAGVFAALFASVSSKVPCSVDVGSAQPLTAFSPRTRGIVANASGSVSITVFLARNDERYRSVTHLLRSMKRLSESVGGVRVVLNYVDPHWDLGAAERLVRQGVSENCVLFERGRHSVAVPLEDGYDECLFSSALRSVMTPPMRRRIYWTTGHGECRYDDYGAFGMSDFARELSREGYEHAYIDISVAEQSIPTDCAMILVAGAVKDFSRIERNRLDAYLRTGGRLLALLNTVDENGVSSLLPKWGVRPKSLLEQKLRRDAAGHIIVQEFGDHVITTPLRGMRVLLESPISFEASAAAQTLADRPKISFTPLAVSGSEVFAVIVECGADVGRDLALRPTRIIAIGDASFAMNGELAARANANRDLLLNSAAYLSGTDAIGVSHADLSTQVIHLDRKLKNRLLLVMACIVPLFVFMLMVMVVRHRRNRR